MSIFLIYYSLNPYKFELDPMTGIKNNCFSYT